MSSTYFREIYPATLSVNSKYEKLGEIISLNDIKSVTLVRMSAPCCARMTDATILAIRNSGKEIPLQIATLFTEGEEVV